MAIGYIEAVKKNQATPEEENLANQLVQKLRKYWKAPQQTLYELSLRYIKMTKVKTLTKPDQFLKLMDELIAADGLTENNLVFNIQKFLSGLL